MTSIRKIPHESSFDEGAKLSKEQVVGAALDYIDAHGLTSLSMRGLAKEIGVYPATLYWYAGNKNQLLALLYHHVLQSIELPSVDDTAWQDWIRTVAQRARGALARHPELASAFLALVPVSVPSLVLADSLLEVLRRAGFSGEMLVHAYNSVLSCVFGWIAEEFAADPGSSDDEWQAQFQHDFEIVKGTGHGAIEDNYDRLANHAWLLRWTTGPGAPLTEGFEFMLDMMLAGLARMVERSAPAGE